jgi:hypothetical protein
VRIWKHGEAEREKRAAAMTTLLIGFDSAWTAENSGALVGVPCILGIRSCGDFVLYFVRSEEVVINVF